MPSETHPLCSQMSGQVLAWVLVLCVTVFGVIGMKKLLKNTKVYNFLYNYYEVYEI